jgi:trimeric autotransporter adhesin
MKRKYFSALLMGALTIASVSTFTSCKDYDDDIDNLQSQIDKAGLQSDIDALKTQLQDAASTASAAKTTAESALAKANDAAVKADVEKAIKAVEATANKAADDVATAISNAANAQTTADGAQKAADAAAKAAKAAQDQADKAVKDAAAAATTANAAAKQADFVKALERIGNLETSRVTADKLDEKLTQLKEELLGADGDKETIGSLTVKVNAYKGAVDELYSAVTSVELVKAYSGVNGFTSDLNVINGLSPLTVDMLHGLISDDSKFGDENGNDAKPVVEYVKGKDIDVKDDASIVVRVNPVNADLTKGAKIILLNSKGESLEDIVKVGNPSKFDKLITTRAAATVNTGLWKLPISVAEGVSEEDFKKAVTVKDENGNEKAILYAVAINNTVDSKAEAAADRYVVSTYDVKPTYNKFVPSNDFTFKVGGKDVEGIHNRWNGEKISGENSRYSSEKNPELAWANDAAAEPVLEGEKKNVENANWNSNRSDVRYWNSLLQVEVGKSFSITDLKTSDNKAADYYYVVLDKDNAIESGVSELNAWKSYTIEGLNEVRPASENLTLTIKTEAANHDIIGFRVYAVNKDGKLLDPDGKAFYVVVGENYTSGIVGNLDAVNKITEKKDFSPVEGVTYGDWEPVDDENAYPLGVKPVFTPVYYDKDGNETTNMAEVTKIAFKVSDPGLIADGAKVSLKSTLKKHTDNYNYYEVGTVTATYTKVLPKVFPADITFRPEQETGKGTGYFIAYMKPEYGYTVTNKSVYGSVDLHNVFYNLDPKVSFEIADAAKDADDKLISVKANEGNSFKVTVAAKDFINSTTKHAVTAKYNYGPISLLKNAKTGRWEKIDHTVDYGKSLSVTFACWHSASSYSWTKQPSLQWKATANEIKTDIKDIAVKNTYNNDFFGGNFEQLLTNKYLEVKPGTAHLTYEGQVDPYFKVTVDAATGKFIFTQTGIQAENAPTVDHTENLEFVVVDAYGHEVPQSFKVTIKRPASK